MYQKVDDYLSNNLEMKERVITLNRMQVDNQVIAVEEIYSNGSKKRELRVYSLEHGKVQCKEIILPT